MSLGLLLPAALAALAALLLPLLIHLARHSQMAPTPFAAMRWLRQAARPQRRVRIEEWPLLLLRLLLLALLALWLARPVLHGEQDVAGWTVAVPGVDAGQVRALSEGTEPPRWLAPGFPPLDQSAPEGQVPVASLLRQLDAELPPEASLTVAVPEWLHGMDAQRPQLSRPVAWHVLPGAMQAPEASPIEPLVLHVRHDGDRTAALRYLRVAAASWGDAEGPAGESLQPQPVNEPFDPAATHLAWLAGGPVPEAVLDWTREGGVLLLDASAEVELPAGSVTWWRSEVGEPLVEGASYGRGRLLRFTRVLAPAQMPELLEPDFPLRLRGVLQGPPAPPASVAAVAHSPLQVDTAWTQSPRELKPWLGLLIALLFLIERWLATPRRRPMRSAGEQS
ncbi:BatA domain-containing protein [Luteimonas sp. A478]